MIRKPVDVVTEYAELQQLLRELEQRRFDLANRYAELRELRRLCDGSFFTAHASALLSPGWFKDFRRRPS
jgi:hypothetical protein